MSTSVAVAVAEASGVGEARRASAALAAAAGLGDELAAKFALVVTELGTNLVKHAGGGTIVLRALSADGVAGAEALALDRGPGMADVARCLRDGFSTAGTRGAGLGAVARAASVFDVHSEAGRGTAVLAQLWPAAGAAWRGEPDVGAVCVPLAGQSACGDAWAAEAMPGRARVFVADGLGHGPLAAEAARAATAVFRRDPWAPPTDLLAACHAALRATRGAAVAVADVDFGRRAVSFAGVGNVAGTVFGPGGERHGLTSHHGIVGHQMRKAQQFEAAWPARGLLVVHSDGLATRATVAGYAGAFAKHPALLAGLLYRDFQRGRDDATVVTAREPARAAAD